MTHPDDATVRVLAEREGWQLTHSSTENYGDVFTVRHNGEWIGDRTMEGAHRSGLPNYLHSLDALRPVFLKLSPEERDTFNGSLLSMWVAIRERYLSVKQEPPVFSYWLLTLDPPALARAVSEAILACRKDVGR